MASSYDEHSPIQIMASSSTTVIHVASVPDIITSILHDDRFKKELASLVDKQIAMKSVPHPSVILCKDLLVTYLEVAAKRQKVDKISKIKPAFTRVARL